MAVEPRARLAAAGVLACLLLALVRTASRWNGGQLSDHAAYTAEIGPVESRADLN